MTASEYNDGHTSKEAETMIKQSNLLWLALEPTNLTSKVAGCIMATVSNLKSHIEAMFGLLECKYFVRHTVEDAFELSTSRSSILRHDSVKFIHSNPSWSANSAARSFESEMVARYPRQGQS